MKTGGIISWTDQRIRVAWLLHLVVTFKSHGIQKWLYDRLACTDVDAWRLSTDNLIYKLYHRRGDHLVSILLGDVWFKVSVFDCAWGNT